MSRNVKKVASADTGPCVFRGACIECPVAEWGHRCNECGWNPEVEAKRKEKMKT